MYTLGVRADLRHVLVPPADVGAELVRTDRGGDVTYHGPGQLVGYPILSLPGKRGGGSTAWPTPSPTSARSSSCSSTRSPTSACPTPGACREYPGVWVDPDGDDPRKIAAIGVRLTRGRSMHGFALNVDPDMRYWGHIVPCGIPDKAVTSLAAEGIDVDMREVVDVVAARAAALWGTGRPPIARTSSGATRPDDLSPFSRGEGPGRRRHRARGDGLRSATGRLARPA